MSQHFPPAYFQRRDESSDHNFYSFPRKVVHIDDGAITALRQYYEQVLPQDAVILDMMSSWRSHLPDNLNPQRVYGLGMNGEEMADNPQLDEYIVQSLNDNPQLPYQNEQFDAVLCAVSVQYLTNPIAVFTEVRRVLKPAGQFIVSFSNRCFPTKAVAIWLNMTDKQHIVLVTRYFELSGDWAIVAETKTSSRHDPMYIVHGTKTAN
ncbi:MAG: class I SAM-dependent methyltransferase [Chloroflexota bacterium]